MALSTSIHPLSPDVIAQIKSSIVITSLNGVIIELLKNSLDARANRIEISVDYSRGSCSVEDDGIGIPPLEFQDSGGLGKLHHTSKQNPKVLTYGSYGLSLASIAALSLISITSCHHGHHSQNTMSINRSQVIARQCPAPPHQHITALNHGTRVTVRDLFGNMPVRVKQRAIRSENGQGAESEWEELRKDVIRFMLAWPFNVRILIRNGITGQKIHLQAPRPIDNTALPRRGSKFIIHLCNILSQGSLIPSPEPTHWVPMDGTAGNVNIHGAMSLHPAPTKAVQFVCLGIKPLGIHGENNILYEEINRLVDKSSFGDQDEQANLNDMERKKRSLDRRYKNDGIISGELKRYKKGIDKWPMFFFKIDIVDSSILNSASIGDDNFAFNGSLLNPLVDLLQAMILEFLKCYQLLNKANYSNTPPDLSSGSFEDRSYPSQRLVINDDVAPYEQITEPQNSHTSNNHSLDKETRKSIQNSNNKQERLKTALTIQMKKAEPPFNMGLRMKSGRSKVAKKISKQDDDLQFSRENAKTREQKLSSAKSTLRRCNTSGHLSSLTKQYITDNTVHLYEAPSSFENDKLLTWINPISGEKSLMDVRTGLVIQSAKAKVASGVEFQKELGNQRQTFINDSGRKAPFSSNNGSSAWMNDILEKWENPIFPPAEFAIPQVSLKFASEDIQYVLQRGRPKYSQFEIDQALRTCNATNSGRISKKALQHAQLISQVDKKFILIMIPIDGLEFADKEYVATKRLLAIVDQHAADERCRVEDLLDELCSAPSIEKIIPGEALPQSGIMTRSLEKPLNFVVSRREIQLLQTFSQHFADWGILFDLPLVNPSMDQHMEERFAVRSLPPVIMERCRMDPKQLIELLRFEAWKCHENLLAPRYLHESPIKNQIPDKNAENFESYAWLERIHRCPQGILDMLNSRSCRSAIMFSDELSNTQCCLLLFRLAECAFPFQCAHGRPSMVPLVDLDMLYGQGFLDGRGLYDCVERFGVRFRRWKNEMVE